MCIRDRGKGEETEEREEGREEEGEEGGRKGRGIKVALWLFGGWGWTLLYSLKGKKGKLAILDLLITRVLTSKCYSVQRSLLKYL